MIPSNPNIYLITDTNRFIRTRFQYPDNISTLDELTDYEYGGIALQDPSKGLQYQAWKGYWDPVDSTAYLQPYIPEAAPDPAPTPIPIFTEPNVVEFSFTFDQNMRWSAVTRAANNTVKFRWYDSAAEAYVVTPYTGMRSVKLCHDDKRDTQVALGSSDMIFTYLTTTGAVCWRIQRDRFLVQYTKAGFTASGNSYISHFGMNSLNRLQWRIGKRHINT